MRDCLLKTMGTTISMMNLHLLFLPETYTGVLFHKFLGGGDQLSLPPGQSAEWCQLA